MSDLFEPERLYATSEHFRVREAFLDLIRRSYQTMFPSVSRTTARRLLAFLFGVLAYCYYKHRKTRCRKVYKRTERNIDILNALLPVIKAYRPTFCLPTAFLQIVYGECKRRPIMDFERQVLTLEDQGEITLEWFPHNFSQMEEKTPIIVFNFGVCGFSRDKYFQDLCDVVHERGWRMVAINRRGFGFNTLTNATFIPKNETADLDFVSKKIKEIFPQANLYMMGVSAGANHAANYLGRAKKDTPIKAFIGISSPFNIGRISFTMKHNTWGFLFSKVIANNMKELYRFHYDNPHFQSMLKAHKLNLDSVDRKLSQRETCWQVDKYITHKLGGHDSVYDYYIDISSEHVLDDIAVPCLFISNEEDPICLKENIPIEKLHRNENTILLFFERGGHIEYFHGNKRERYGYTLAMRYIEYMEKQSEA